MRTLRKYEIKIPRNENYYIWSNHLTNVLRTKKRVHSPLLLFDKSIKCGAVD